jgi:hypothetical protein
MAVFQNTIANDLASGDPDLQLSGLLAVIALLSAGRDVTPFVSIICQRILGNPNVPVDLRLKAYDIIKGTILSDADSQLLVQGILSDLQLDPLPANDNVQAAALIAIQSLPTHRLVSFMSDHKIIGIVRAHLRGGQPLVRAAGTQSIAAVMSFDTMMKLLTENDELKDMFANFVANLSSMLVETEVELTLGGAKALESLLTTMSLKIRRSNLTTHRSKESSDYSKSLVLALSICEDAVLRIDGMFAEILPRFRALGLESKRQILAFLVAYLEAKVLVYSLNNFDFRPGEILRHQMDEVVNFLAECAADCDPSLVVESTKSLLSLAKIDKSSASLFSQVTISIQASIDCVNSLEGRYQHVAQQGLLDAFLAHMDALPAAQQVTLFGKLPQMIATVPSSRQRVKSFVKLWSSVAGYDWKLNSCINHECVAGDETEDRHDFMRGSQVQHILLEKHMKDCVAAISDSQSDQLHIRYLDPLFREEVVGSLLYVLLSHPAPVTGLTNSLFLGRTSANSALIATTGIQAVGTALDWLSTSKSSLQNTKPCLGWDRAAGISTTGTTACVDLWLQLLLRCISISNQLKCQLDTVQVPKQLGESPSTKLIPALKQQAAVLDVDFQGLLLQISTNWRALHPVVRPRAIWACAYNLKMKSALDSAWSSIADALRSLLVEAEHMGPSNPTRYFASAVEGSIKTYPVMDNKRRSSHDPFVAAAAGETEEICVLVLERLANLLASNHCGDLIGKLVDVGKLLTSLIGVCMSKKHLSPSSMQRMERLLRLLAPVVSSGRQNQSRNGNLSSVSDLKSLNLMDSHKDTIAKSQVSHEPDQRASVVELKDELPNCMASYPSTIPSSPSLVHSDVVSRYQHFLSDLQNAIVSADELDLSSHFNRQDVGLPSLSTALEVLETEQNSWSETTGLISPVSLSFCHTLEPTSSTVRLKCRIENKTSEKISGIEVQLMMGGPIALHRRPLSYKIHPLESSDTHEWEMPCRCLSFGWPIVQAFIVLPVDCPSISGQTYQQGSLRCKPYIISPLELILKVHRPLPSVEFFQAWQTFPHRANAYASPTENGIRGIIRVLSAVESCGLVCSAKVLVPVPGGIYAAYSGISWSGHMIALIVSTVSMTIGKDKEPTKRDEGAVLHFHFGSDVSEVIFPMRGHEHDLVSQLTKGRAVPVSPPLAGRNLNKVDSASSGSVREEDRSQATQSTFSFFKSVIQNYDTDDEEEDVDEKRRLALAQRKQGIRETYALASAATDVWKTLVRAPGY